MSDLTFPDDGLAELASAYLDGAATADERARVEANPQLMALVSDLRSVSRSLAETPVVAPDSLREQQLAAALAIFVTTDEAAAKVPVARRPSWRTRWLTPLIGAGAATVIVAGVGLAALGGDDGGLAGNADQVPAVADAGPATSLEAATKMAAPAESTAAGGGAPTAGANPSSAADVAVPANAEILSSVALAAAEPEASDPAELPGLVASLSATSLPDADRSGDPCPQVGGTLVSPLRWQGTEAYLYVVPALEPGAQVLAVDAASCATLATSVLAA